MTTLEKGTDKRYSPRNLVSSIVGWVTPEKRVIPITISGDYLSWHESQKNKGRYFK